MTLSFVPKGCAALIAATVLVVASPAGALPAGGLGQLLDATAKRSSQFESVQYRGQYDGRRSYRSDRYAGNRYRRNDGRNLALGIGGLVIGGILLSEAARSEHRREYSSEWQRCGDTYRSFEPETGMYTGYDGTRRTCPYLR